MADNSSIEWTDSTDNIIVAVDSNGAPHGWWCRKISPGCAHCYAEDFNQKTYFHGNQLPYSGQPPVLKLREDIIDGWARQKKAKKHFVASMTDVFGEWVPRSWIFRMLDGMRSAWRQIFQLLTKRADVMLREVTAWLEARGLTEVPRNIWLMVSVEDQPRADERVPLLMQIPAVRGLSVEPLLGPVDLTRHFEVKRDRDWLGCTCVDANAPCDVCDALGPRPAIDWVIVGYESGKKARAGHPDWALALRNQCQLAGVPFFYKQHGSWIAVYDRDKDDPDWRNVPTPKKNERYINIVGGHGFHGERVVLMRRVAKKKAGRLLDGRTWDEFPEIAIA